VSLTSSHEQPMMGVMTCDEVRAYLPEGLNVSDGTIRSVMDQFPSFAHPQHVAEAVLDVFAR
jgi:hypothetical protein